MDRGRGAVGQRQKKISRRCRPVLVYRNDLPVPEEVNTWELIYRSKLLGETVAWGHRGTFSKSSLMKDSQLPDDGYISSVKAAMCQPDLFPSLILLLPLFGHTQRKGDHHHSFHLWEVLSLRQGHLTKWSCLSRAFSLLIASKGHTNGHQLPLPQDSSLEISYYYYQGHIHSSFEHPP